MQNLGAIRRSGGPRVEEHSHNDSRKLLACRPYHGSMLESVSFSLLNTGNISKNLNRGKQKLYLGFSILYHASFLRFNSFFRRNRNLLFQVLLN